MKLTDLSKDINPWLSGNGPMADVVMSSRIRLARNLAGRKFVSRCSAQDKAEILEQIKEVLLSIDLGDPAFYVGIDRTPALHRNFLVERHLISRNHAMGEGPRGAVISRTECFTGMINEEDHLRLQVLRSGCQLAECARQIDRIDDQIEQRAQYAFSSRYGYLTACPTNLGSGVRISVMVHLPALKMTGHLQKVLNAAKDMNLAVRGLFGEGTEATSDLYQVSNQGSLGVSEGQIVSEFETAVVPQVVDYENAARRHLMADQPDSLDDKVSRALALLQSARLISSQETLTLLSHLRLGVQMGLSLGAATPSIERLCSLFGKDPDQQKKQAIPALNRLFMLTLPAHLQLNSGKLLDATRRDVVRADIIRSVLGKN